VTGQVQITYTVSDGKGGTDTAVLTVTVGNNTPPEGADATANGTEDTPLVLTPANFPFTDPDAGQGLAAVRIDALPANGTLLLNGVAVSAGQLVSAADIAAGRLTFVPGANGNGTGYASLRFTVQDTAGAFDAAPNTLRLDIAPVNDAPVLVAPPTGTVTAEDTPLAGTVQAADPDGDALGYTVTQGPAHGTLVINPDGSYVYTPARDFNGADSFTVEVSDGRGGTLVVTVPVNVTPVNDAPVARPDAAIAPAGAAVTIDVLGNDTDADGDALTVRAIDGVAIAPGGSVAVEGGRVTLNANGTLTFVPNAGFTGTPSFSYTVADSAGAEATGTVGLVVTAAPAPVPPATSGGADVEQLLATGQPIWLQGGRDPRGEADTKDRGLRPMYAPAHIIEAVNGIRSLHGTAALDAQQPVRSAVDGIRTLDGTKPLDTATPILDLAEHLQQRFQLRDPVRALFTTQADARILDATRAGNDVVLSGERAAANDGDAPVPADATRAVPSAARGAAMLQLDVDALTFSEQIAFHVGQSFAETDQLAAALRTQIPPVPVNP
jgi:VCBS repeat-containing protein